MIFVGITLGLIAYLGIGIMVAAWGEAHGQLFDPFGAVLFWLAMEAPTLPPVLAR